MGTSIDANKVLTLIREGCSPKYIRNELGCPSYTLYSWLGRHRYERELAKMGYTYEQIVEIMKSPDKYLTKEELEYLKPFEHSPQKRKNRKSATQIKPPNWTREPAEEVNRLKAQGVAVEDIHEKLRLDGYDERQITDIMFASHDSSVSDAALESNLMPFMHHLSMHTFKELVKAIKWTYKHPAEEDYKLNEKQRLKCTIQRIVHERNIKECELFFTDSPLFKAAYANLDGKLLIKQAYEVAKSKKGVNIDGESF